MAIIDFIGRLKVLSMMHKHKVEFRGLVFPSIFHATVAGRFWDDKLAKKIARTHDPIKARNLCTGFPVDRNWNHIRLSVMEDLVKQKFSKDPLRTILLDTHPHTIWSLNQYGDRFWGIVEGEGGENNYGKILVSVREALRSENNFKEGAKEEESA